MRAVTNQIANAFMRKEKKTIGNSTVIVENNIAKMYLHGNLIAINGEDGIQITNAGWFSNTTKERLNAIPDVNIQQKKGIWYLNGKQWNGELVKVANF